MRNNLRILLLALTLVLLSACYNRPPATSEAYELTEEQMDSLSFYSTHHYTQNFNFLVKADSLSLKSDPYGEVSPEFMDGEMLLVVDSVVVRRGDHIVVADIKTVVADSIDSVWVKVARDQSAIGWVRESELLPAVSPDDPISVFIDTFSNKHLLFFLALLVLVGGAYGLRKLYRHNAYIVHFKDIPTSYPTALAILVAASATFYSSIQLFGPETWRHFYYHPTLNPFIVPLHLRLFLMSVWAILILTVATVDDVRRHLPLGDAVLYLLGLAGVCAVLYVVFSVTTMYYIGYPLLIAYVIFAVHRYSSRFRNHYICGNCGGRLRRKGRCPHCGALNV